MEALLTIAVVLIAVAIITQAGVLIAMYMLSRRLANNVNDLMEESRRLMTPVEIIGSNLKATSEDLQEMTKSVREQVEGIESTVGRTVDDVRNTIMTPVREFSAITRGIQEGVRVFFSQRPRPEEKESREVRAA
jgi:hypothetical protein